MKTSAVADAADGVDERWSAAELPDGSCEATAAGDGVLFRKVTARGPRGAWRRGWHQPDPLEGGTGFQIDASVTESAPRAHRYDAGHRDSSPTCHVGW